VSLRRCPCRPSRINSRAVNTQCDHYEVNVCSQCRARSIYLLSERCTQDAPRTTITPNHNPNQQEIDMCHRCAPMYLAELPPAAQEAISRLNTLSAAIDEASISVNKTEDIYRDSAIVYHCSQLAARSRPTFPKHNLTSSKNSSSSPASKNTMPFLARYMVLSIPSPSCVPPMFGTQAARRIYISAYENSKPRLTYCLSSSVVSL
jgi:hypothetical protein